MTRTALKDVRFHNPRLARVGVEVMSLRELRSRTGAAPGPPERVDFLALLFVQAGSGRHMVDFAEVALRPGTVLLVRPGQVQQWRLTPSLQGLLVLVSGEALAPAVARDMKLLALDEWPASLKPSRRLFGDAIADVERMRGEIQRFAGGDVEAAIIRHQLMALLLRLARGREAGAAPREDAGLHRLFLRELEAGFHQRLSVLDYAKRLGYSESSLSRACVAASGRTAKQAVDDRVALEARRLLAHGDDTVVQVAHRLGFSEPTNFVKFFRRTCGATPLGFRAGIRTGPAQPKVRGAPLVL